MHLPEIGALFAEKYQILELLGSGGFARVYRAHDTSIGRDVAIKVLTPSDGGYPERVQKRFVREARVIAELQGEFTITMFEFGTSADGLLYMVFEFVAGEDLKSVLERSGHLAPSTTEHVLRQILKGLAEAHSLGVLHRDIKPGNVLIFQHLDDSFRAKLIDFGIAKLFTPEGKADVTRLTADGSVIGTPRYLAPEQFYGEELTPAADLYSAGLVAVEMLTGTYAVQGQGREEVLRNQLSSEPLFVPDTPGSPQLAFTLRAMVARDPNDRPRSAGAALRMLDDVSISGSTSGPFVPRLPRADANPNLPVAEQPPPRRGATMVVLAALGAIAALALVTVALNAPLDETEPEPEVVARSTERVSPLIRSREPAEPAAPINEKTADLGQADAGGCDAPSTGFWSGEFFDGLEPHRYDVYVPERAPGVRLPVVFVAHRLFGNGDREFIRETRFHEEADEFGFILLSIWWNGDPDIDQMATHYTNAYEVVQRRACVDTERLFAVGHAGAGRHVRKLRCVIDFSAIAGTSDGHRTDEVNCQAKPVPFLHLWGRDDPHLPQDGSTSCMGKKYLTPDDLIEEWRQLNGCKPGSTKWRTGPRADCTMLTCEAAVVHCMVDGGFDWPHAPEPFEFPGCKSEPMKVPVGRMIWKFFAEHGQPL